jgi:hypothetical protein
VAVAGLLAVVGISVAFFTSVKRQPPDSYDEPPDLPKIVPVINDDFSAPSKDVLDSYPPEVGPEQEIGMENGRFVVRLLPFQGGPTDRRFYWRANRWHLDEGDFACEVVARIRTGGDHGWALCLISHNQKRDLAIRMSRDGMLEVGNIIWKKGIFPNHLIKPLKPSAIQLGDNFNTLRIICRGGRRLEIFVNGSRTGPPISLDPPFLPVYPGLAVWQRIQGTQEELRAEFSRFTVWQLPNVAPGHGP